MKIVINTRHGGFGISEVAVALITKLSGTEPDTIYEITRDNKFLIEAVETLGEKANTRFSRLKVVEIPDDVYWEISEYDGLEHVREISRTWF